MTGLIEVWRYQGGGYLSNDFVYGVAVAADNSVFLLGSQDDFGNSSTDYAAVKIDANGDFLWEWKEGSEGHESLYAAAAVVDGVVGCGFINGTWNEVPSLGGADFAVVKLHSNGTVAWRWKEGTDEDDFLSEAVETIDGNVVVAGNTLGSWNDINDDWNDVAVAKLNANDGEVMWRYQNGTTEDAGAYLRAATARGDGSVVLGGFTYGSFATVFEGDDGATDFLAVALDEDGNELWRWQDGPGTGFSGIYGIAAFDDGSILLAGKTGGSWAIDYLGEGDFAVAKLNASGYLEWSWQEGTEFDEEFAAAAIGIDGSVILSGYTYGSWAATQAGSEFDRDFVAMSINAKGDILWRYQFQKSSWQLKLQNTPLRSCAIQAGGTSSEDFNDVAVRPDGLIILGGWTSGTWTTPETSDWYSDFAAVLLNATTPTTSSAPFPSPSPAFSATSPPISLTTPSPTPFPTPSPITSPTLSQPSPSSFGSSSTNDTTIKEHKTSTESDSEDPVGLIVGSLVGGAAVVAILIACCFCWWRGGKGSKTNPPPAASSLLAAPVSAVLTGLGSSIAPPPAYTDPPPAYSSVA